MKLNSLSLKFKLNNNLRVKISPAQWCTIILLIYILFTKLWLLSVIYLITTVVGFYLNKYYSPASWSYIPWAEYDAASGKFYPCVAEKRDQKIKVVYKANDTCSDPEAARTEAESMVPIFTGVDVKRS